MSHHKAIHGLVNYNKTEAKHIVTEAEVNHGTQICYRIKDEGGVPPESSMTFERVDKTL